jgi:hypothetical protein
VVELIGFPWLSWFAVDRWSTGGLSLLSLQLLEFGLELLTKLIQLRFVFLL